MGYGEVEDAKLRRVNLSHVPRDPRAAFFFRGPSMIPCDTSSSNLLLIIKAPNCPYFSPKALAKYTVVAAQSENILATPTSFARMSSTTNASPSRVMALAKVE